MIRTTGNERRPLILRALEAQKLEPAAAHRKSLFGCGLERHGIDREESHDVTVKSQEMPTRNGSHERPQPPLLVIIACDASAQQNVLIRPRRICRPASGECFAITDMHECSDRLWQPQRIECEKMPGLEGLEGHG